MAPASEIYALKETLMKHKTATLTVLVLMILVFAGVLFSRSRPTPPSASQQEQIAALKELRDTGVINEQEYEAKLQALQSGPPQNSADSDDTNASGNSQQKIAALKDLRDTGVISQQEYEAKVQALRAGAPQDSTASDQAARPRDSGNSDQARAPQSAPASDQASGFSWSDTRQVEIDDPQYQMRAYTMAIPANWRFAGTIARPRGCHANGWGTVYTAESADGSTAVILLPSVQWNWNSRPDLQRQMAARGCPPVEFTSPEDFLLQVALPMMRPKAELLTIDPPSPQMQAGLDQQLEKMREENAAMARQYGQRPQELSLEGAAARIKYQRNGQTVEELVAVVVGCTGSRFAGNMVAGPNEKRQCQTRGTYVSRAPLGKLDAILPQLSKVRGFQTNQEWHTRLDNDLRMASDQAIAQSWADHNARMAESDRFMAIQTQNWQAGEIARAGQVNRALAQGQADMNARDAEAKAVQRAVLGQGLYRDPATGQQFVTSTRTNHMWQGSGGTFVGNDDPNFNPNSVPGTYETFHELEPGR
jgi:Short C-terminal domain